MADRKEFMIEDADILFRNFSGREDQFNREGNRNFCAILDQAVARQMAADGWSIRNLAAREEGDEDRPYVQITVSYKVRPPKIVMIAGEKRTTMSEDMISVLDWADIVMVDLIASGYDWTVGDKSGTKAYLQSMYVTIREDALERKYGSLE